MAKFFVILILSFIVGTMFVAFMATTCERNLKDGNDDIIGI